jgi:hypothetical protein
VRGAILRLSGCSGQDRPLMQVSSPGELESGDRARDSAPIALFDGRRRSFQALKRLRGTNPAVLSLVQGQSCPAVPDKRNLWAVRFPRKPREKSVSGTWLPDPVEAARLPAIRTHSRECLTNRSDSLGNRGTGRRCPPRCPPRCPRRCPPRFPSSHAPDWYLTANRRRFRHLRLVGVLDAARSSRTAIGAFNKRATAPF